MGSEVSVKMVQFDQLFRLVSCDRLPGTDQNVIFGPSTSILRTSGRRADFPQKSSSETASMSHCFTPFSPYTEPLPGFG
jgi:hypothetical protein